MALSMNSTRKAASRPDRPWRRTRTARTLILDAMVRIRWPRTIAPEVALATQHYAIVGDLGSRYHEKAERKTRCTQIGYDRMHLDVTPSILLPYLPEKTSLIFQSKPSDPSVVQQTLYANPFGLAEWFNARVVVDEAFASSSRIAPWGMIGFGLPRPRQIPPSFRCRCLLSASRGKSSASS